MLRRSALQAAVRVNKNGPRNVLSVVVACPALALEALTLPGHLQTLQLKRDSCLDDRPELHSITRQQDLAQSNAVKNDRCVPAHAGTRSQCGHVM